MKQGNNTSRVDKGWALMQPELDKAFPPKRETKLWPFFLVGFVMITITTYLLTTQTQDQHTSPSNIHNFATTTPLESNSITLHNKKTSAFESSDKDNSTQLLNIESSADFSFTNRKKSAASLVQQNNESENTVELPLAINTKPIFSKSTIALQSKKLSTKPKTNSTANNIADLDKITNNVLNEKKLPIANLTAIKQLPTLPFTTLSKETKKSVEISDINPIKDSYKSPKLLSAQLKSSAVYNVQNNSLATEFTGGIGMKKSAWRLGLDIGLGHRTFNHINISSQRNDANAIADDTRQSESDSSAGTNVTPTPQGVRHSIPRDMDESRIAKEANKLYALGQLTAQYNSNKWSLAGNVGVQWNQFQRQLNRNDIPTASVGNGFVFIQTTNTSLFAGTEVAYAIGPHMDLGLGYRRILSETDLGKNYLTVSADYTF